MDIHDLLDEDVAWRIKELSDLMFVIKSHDVVSKSIVRCGLPILYAHWEGFVKKSSDLYIEHIISHRFKIKELRREYYLLSVTRTIREIENCGDVNLKISHLIKLVTRLDEVFKKYPKDMISTESNLSSKVLKKITDSLGIDYSIFSTYEKFIDERLLAKRNNIAHGKTAPIDKTEYIEIHDKVIELIRIYKNEISNAAARKSYLFRSSVSLH